MSMIQFFRILAARRAVLLAALLGSFIIATLMTYVLPRRYEATARVMLDALKPDPVTGVSMGNMFRVYAKTQTELIEDYQTAGRVVDKLGWASDPGLMADYANATNGEGQDIRRWLAKQIQDTTRAQIVEPSNILEIKFSGQSPEAAKRVAGLIREAYIEASLDYRRDGARKSADWYRDQAVRAKTLLTTAEEERSKFARANGVVLQANNVDVESAKLTSLSSQSAVVTAGPQMPIITGPTTMPMVGGANLQLETLNQQISQAGQTLGPKHPSYQALLRQKSVLEAEAARERVARSASNPRITMPRQRNLNAEVESAYSAQKARVLAQQDKIDKLNQMTNDIEVKRAQYVKAEERAADLRLESAVGDAGLTPLGDATASETPTFPKVPLIMGGSIGFGGALGICLALLIELLGRKVRSDEDLEYAAKAPVFAIIGETEGTNRWYHKLARTWHARLLDRRERRLAGAN
jgi:polysaccharide biosynthesis transport protein